MKIGEEITKDAVNIINQRGKNYGDIEENHDYVQLVLML